MATPAPGLMGRLKRLLRHRWTDEATLRRALPPEALARIGERVAASERRHPARQRAITLFGKLRVWDTAQNNGVLIYLLLAEHAIEIVADRGIDLHVDAADWAAMAKRMAQAFRDGRFEDGLTQALEEVSALLVQHFPADPNAPARGNELPDAPVVLL
ncbi:MAG: hypothetical protein DI563_22710 [Variovorax paradoxus]|uniref:TPM domain-containing protein n=1 Tax=Variovorax paradoxus TaxID=34073 RepID=A0A2W5PMU3_VARPD|nr:MAG: hypothetical protein DI563_22710 [Variovorax paradoxus]